MKPKQCILSQNRCGLAGWLLLLASAAFVVVAGGCGDLNDNPNNSSLGVTVAFNDNGSASASGSEPNQQSPQAITSPAGEQVLTLVVGAIVITHEKVPGGGIVPYTFADINTLNETQRELLEKDAEQSVVFLEIVQLPTASNFVEFDIPPDNAGKWQLIAVGMRHRIEALDEILDNSPIYYGFIDTFLNNLVTPGTAVTQTLLLDPGCGLQFQPQPPCP